MTREIKNKLVDTIATLLDIAGCPTMELLNKWKELPTSVTLYDEIDNAGQILVKHISAKDIKQETRNLFSAAYHIADAIAHAEKN